MERLPMRDVRDILFRLRKGETERATARQTHNHRRTIAHYRRLAEEHGLLDPGLELPTETELLALLGEPARPPLCASSVDPYADLVKGWVSNHVEIRSMYRQLVEHHGYVGSYGSVLRFVRRAHPVQVEAYVRIETAPGEEAQVDFGTVGTLKDPTTGLLRTAYCFVMTLCCSRHQYVEFVFDQKMATFLGCHKRAFEKFGGVVRRVVIDNLKAAVLKHDMEDPLLSAPYKSLAQHYGFVSHPCRPRTPQHKGKVESGVHYVKRNLWPELVGQELHVANVAAAKWVAGYAGLRTHGTTQKQPLLEFERTEGAALLPLPERPFTFERATGVKVHNDAHVRVEDNFYSAPHSYVGKSLEAYVYEGTVQLYDKCTLVATHERKFGKGERATRSADLPEYKRTYLERTPEYCQERSREVGPNMAVIATALASDRVCDRRRALTALVGLLDKHPAERVEAACRLAVECGDLRYSRVRRILASGAEEQSAERPVEQSAPQSYRFARRPEEFFELAEADLSGQAPC